MLPRWPSALPAGAEVRASQGRCKALLHAVLGRDLLLGHLCRTSDCKTCLCCGEVLNVR